MKKTYLILALVITSMAVALVIRQNRFLSQDANGLQQTRDHGHQRSAATGYAVKSAATGSAQRKNATNLSPFAIESVDPRQAQEVQQLLPFAKKRLEILDGELALNATQQKRIFELIMAYSAPEDLALQVGGRSIQVPEMSMEDAILQELDPDRARIYQQSLIDHASWWNHAIEEMEHSIADESDPPIVEAIEIQ